MGAYYAKLLYDCENNNNQILNKKYKGNNTYNICVILIGLEYLRVICNYQELIENIRDEKEYFIIGYERGFLFKTNRCHIYVKLNDKKLRYFLQRYGKIYKNKKDFIFCMNKDLSIGKRILIYNCVDTKVFDYRFNSVITLSNTQIYTIIII
jgi:hypothetical protein